MATQPEGALESLPPALDERAWEALLSEQVGAPVEVRYGRARREVVQLRRERGRLQLRLGRVMEHAPPPVQAALAEWIARRGTRSASLRVLDHWIELRLRELARQAPAAALSPRGAHHDLEPVARELARVEFAAHFGERGLPALGWGRAGRSRSRRSLRLGSFDPLHYSVRVHPVLDSAQTPGFFVRYILFHELLHAVLDGPPQEGARRRTHGPEFRARERSYVDFERSREWEREHIGALIACARAGAPFAPAGKRASRRPPPPRAPQPQHKSWAQRLLF